jgi:chromate transport protein ChrA
MHIVWENGGLTIHGLAMLLTVFPALLSIILILIGHKTGSRAAWTAGMMAMSLAVVGFLFPRILSLLDGDMQSALIASAALAALAVMIWLWPYLKR